MNRRVGWFSVSCIALSLFGCDSGQTGQAGTNPAPSESTAVEVPASNLVPSGDGGAQADTRTPTTAIVAGDDASPTKIAACCADVQTEAGNATPHRKLVYTAALQVCKTLLDSPAAAGGLISVRTLLRDVTLPPSCE